MRRRGIGVAALLCLMSGCSSTAAPAPRPDILIVSDFPASGQPYYVTPIQDAIQLAIDQNPRIRGYRIGYLPFDDSLGSAAWPARGLQNLKRMFADPRVLAMVGPHNSYMALEEIPRASAANLVMLSGSVTNQCLTVAPLCDADLEAARVNGPNNFFRIAPSDPLQGRAMARFTAQLHVTRVATINLWMGPPFGYGAPYVEQFQRELTAKGGQVVLSKDVPRPTHDFTDFLTQARLSGADTVYAVGDPDVGICDLRTQMKGDFKYLLVNDGVTGNDDCLKSTGLVPATFGTLGAVDATQSTDATAISVVKAFHAAYPHGDNELYALAAYDCARILITAIERAIAANGGGVPTRLEVLEQVAHGEFPGGATGSYSFLPSGDAVSPTMSIWGVKDNHWYYIDRVDASAAP